MILNFRSIQTNTADPLWAGRILSPSGGVVTHFDRFLLPSIAQVEYRLGKETHFLVTAVCTPVEEHLTRIHAFLQFRTRLPGWLVRAMLAPIADRIFRQDAGMLARQTAALERFGEERYVSTDLDVLGLQILRLLKRGEEGAADPSDWSRVIEMEV